MYSVHHENRPLSKHLVKSNLIDNLHLLSKWIIRGSFNKTLIKYLGLTIFSWFAVVFILWGLLYVFSKKFKGCDKQVFMLYSKQNNKLRLAQMHEVFLTAL